MNKIANVENIVCSAETMSRHPELYHYTKPTAFEGIVGTQTLWCSHYRLRRRFSHVPGHTYLHRKDGGNYYILRRPLKVLLPAFVKNGERQRLVKVAHRTKNLPEARRRMRHTAVEVRDPLDKTG